MRCIIGGVSYPLIDGSSVSITRAMSDPVPTCTVNIYDAASTVNIQSPMELLILDDQVTPNPTANMLLNPLLSPYNANWTASSNTGITLSQNGGGGLVTTISNMPIGTSTMLTQQSTVIPWYPATGQTYMFSCYVQGSGTINQVQARIGLIWYDFAGNQLSSAGFTASPLTTSLVRYTIQSTAPANTGYVQVQLQALTASGSNSAIITFTEPQFEPVWFPTLSYPTPWCGPSQTNCQQLPLGYYIRQYRKFAGLVNHTNPQNYHGNVRTYQVNAVGYAWLAGTIYVNDSFSGKTDTQIITSLTNAYLTSAGTALCNLSNVVTGITLTTFQSNWDSLRTLFDNLASQSTFYWTIDYYWNFIYSPAGYITMPIGLICDNSSTPDMVTTYPAYTFSSEEDFTQPGSTILAIGSGTNVAKVVDPAQTAQLGITSGYQLPTGSSWMRVVNESTLGSVADCTQRGMAELLQYDYARELLHLSTNVEIIAGEGIPVTSNTEGLYQSVLLIQQVQAKWLGTSETLTDLWEYQADLGAVNRAATHILSRIFRLATSNSSAPAISSTTLAVIENLGVTDTIDNNSLYAEAILAHSPKAYYRLGEPPGYSITTIYDWSGNIYTGTLNGTYTLGQTGAIYNDSNTAILFDGATAYATLNTGMNGNGATVLGVMGWFKLSTASLGSTSMMIASGTTAAHAGYQLYWSSTTSLNITIGNGTTSATATYTTSPVAGVYQFIAATYDGSNLRLFVNIGNTVTQVAITAYSGTISASATPVLAGDTSHGSLYPGTIDEVSVFYIAPGIALLQQFYDYGVFGHA